MEYHHFGHYLALASIPLESELNVRPSRIPVRNRVIPNMMASLDESASVEELKEANRSIAVDVRHPTRRHWKLWVKPVCVFITVIAPRPGVGFESLPRIPTDHVLPIGSVNIRRVEVCPVEQPAKRPG